MYALTITQHPQDTRPFDEVMLIVAGALKKGRKQYTIEQNRIILSEKLKKHWGQKLQAATHLTVPDVDGIHEHNCSVGIAHGPI